MEFDLNNRLSLETQETKEPTRQNSSSHSSFQKEFLRSATIENLISQNDDLMARLKVTLRHLSQLELENKRLIEEAQSFHSLSSTYNDQILVLKEKDGFWKQRLENYEKENKVYKEKFEAVKNAYGEAHRLNSRYKKYHDKIRTQIKPYLENLKQYAKDLEVKLSDFQLELSKKEAEMQDLRFQIIELSKNYKYQSELQQKNYEETINSYELSMTDLKRRCDFLQPLADELEMKNKKLHFYQEQAVGLENELIEYRRLKEQTIENLELELKKKSDKVEMLIGENKKLEMEAVDMKSKIMDDYQKVQTLEKEHFDLKHQMESLRYMWTKKNEENEKLKESLSSLEKLNIDLSNKISELRKKDDV